MDKNSRKLRNQDRNPCIEESDASHKCLDSYNYNKNMCTAYFQRYKSCRKYWVSMRLLEFIGLNLGATVVVVVYLCEDSVTSTNNPACLSVGVLRVLDVSLLQRS
ncbi:coiled-coil-helix-coiled-coil-helix domain-containing protein 7 isoform X1 [Vanacampus margaritifer]